MNNTHTTDKNSRATDSSIGNDIGLWRNWNGNGVIADFHINLKKDKDYTPTPADQLHCPAPGRFGKARINVVNSNGRQVELTIHPNEANMAARYNRSNMPTDAYTNLMQQRRNNTVSGHHRSGTASQIHLEKTTKVEGKKK